MQKPHKRLLNHTRVTPPQQEPSCRPGKLPGTHTKLEKDQTSVVAQPNLPQTPFSKLQTRPKAPRIDPRSIFSCCKIQQVDFQINRLISLNLSKISRLKTKSTY